MSVWRFVVALVATLPVLCNGAPSEPRYVAMLEDLHHTGRDEKTLEYFEAYRQAVRVLFVSVGGVWQSSCPSKPFRTVSDDCPLAEFQSHRGWLRFRSAHPLGVETNGVRERESCCNEIGLLKVADSQPLGANEEKRYLFSGWKSVPKAKPQVLISPDVRRAGRHDVWHSMPAPPVVPEWARQVISERWLSEKNCSVDRSGASTHEYGTRLAAKDLRVAGRFTSPSDGELVELRLTDGYRSSCLGDEGKGVGIWVVRPRASPARVVVLTPLISNLTLDRLTPVEQGDFDGDGRPEFLFWYSGYNQDGYVLLSDGLSKTTTFLWAYH